MTKRFAEYGGMYVPESLTKPLAEVAKAFESVKKNEAFLKELSRLLTQYAGRPTPVTYAKNLSERFGQKIFLKREDLLHGGAHKTNNTLGQGLLAKHMGKTRIIAETGAGQHGVATAMIGALLKTPVEVYMGAVDVERQHANVERMKLFGATVHAVESGSATLKDAINEALRDWVTHVDTFYLFGTAAGPYPFPALVSYFQRVIGIEARQQMLTKTGHLPDAVFACVGGGSNAIGIYQGFLSDESVKLYGAEAAGDGIETGKHAATLTKGSPGIFHGMFSKFLQDADGQIAETHSVSAGLDYPGIGPEHVALQESGRVVYEPITDKEAIEAFELIAKEEGILAAIESSHALAQAIKAAKTYPKDSTFLINLSGRGDKDLDNYLTFKSTK